MGNMAGSNADGFPQGVPCEQTMVIFRTVRGSSYPKRTDDSDCLEFESTRSKQPENWGVEQRIRCGVTPASFQTPAVYTGSIGMDASTPRHWRNATAHRLSARFGTRQLHIKMPVPFFLFFDVDADRELKVPIPAVAPYMLLHEGRPARLRKCRVMVRVSGQARWFLVITRYDETGVRNHAVQETTGFHWLGPLAIVKLEKRGSRRPTGITSSRDFHAAISALERYVPACPFSSRR